MSPEPTPIARCETQKIAAAADLETLPTCGKPAVYRLNTPPYYNSDGCLIVEVRAFDKATQEWVYERECVNADHAEVPRCPREGEMFRYPRGGSGGGSSKDPAS